MEYICKIAVRVGADYFHNPVSEDCIGQLWREICDCLSRRTKHSHLHIVIQGHGPDVRETPWKPYKDSGYGTRAGTDLDVWVLELQQITGLDELCINQITERPVDEAFALIAMLQSSMLKEHALRRAPGPECMFTK